MRRKDKTGKSYENLVQVIFQSIINQKDLPNLSVKRNVILCGKTTSHQIDIHWKFEVGVFLTKSLFKRRTGVLPLKRGS